MLTLSRFWFIELIIGLTLHWKQSFGQNIIHLNAPHGNITTPNYPNDYNNKYTGITWQITGRLGQRIRIEVKDLILRDGSWCSSCYCDTLEIFDGFHDLTPFTTLCLSITSPKVFYSRGNKIVVLLYMPIEKVNRRMWLDYVSTTLPPTQSTPTAKLTTQSSISPAALPIIFPTMLPTTSSKSSSTSPKSTLVPVVTIVIVVTIVTVVCFILTYGLSRRLSRRRSTPNQQNSTATQDHVNSTVLQQTAIEFADLDQPPSYDEAIRSSQPSVNYPYTVSQEPGGHTGVTTSIFPQTNGDHNQSTQEAYDSSGLPSYIEAHRLSQGSLNCRL